MIRYLGLALTFFFASAAFARQPNVVIILSDDQGWGDLSGNGNANLSTPNIDSLAKDGARFEHFYVCPVCSPTRAEFLTGRYHQRGGVYSTSAGGERLDLDERTIAEAFQKAGYATGAFGKWHNGTQFPYHPNGRGFDLFYGFCSGHWGNYFSPMFERNGEVVQGEGFCIDDFTNQAIAFVEENQDRPFFLYVPYNTPHSPMQVPDEYWNRFRDKELTMRNRDPEKEEDAHVRCALAMCENIDWNVGRVLDKLEELDLSNDTIVLYFSDNGPNGWRWNGGMKGKKGATDEGGVRSPLVIRWPGTIDPGTEVKVLGGAIDLYPTLAEMAGVEVISEKPLDGVSLFSAIKGEPEESLLERPVFSSWKKRYSVRTPRFRLDFQGKLFDMENDPRQEKDVSAKYPDVSKELKEQVSAYQKEMEVELGTDTRPFVIAHPGYRYTWIPARDGIAHGNITRSNKFPNDSFFENWTSLDDKITWEAEVAADGKYQVTLYYTCPEGSEGSEIELAFNDSSVRGKIGEAYDPPLLGSEHDRYERAESYVKNFRPLDLGTMELSKGVGTLELRTLSKPGPEVMDFRLIVLERVSE